MPRSEQMSLMDYQLQEVEVRLKLEEGKTLYSTDPISNSERAAEVMADVMKELDREVVCVVNLDNKLRPINYNIVSIGGLNSSVVPIQNVFKSSILSNSYGVLLIHNHPSGMTAPSAEDYEVTKKMISAGKLLDTPMLDHCIVGGGTGEIYSFRRSNPEMWQNEPDLGDILKGRKGRNVQEEIPFYGKGDRKMTFDEFKEYAVNHITDYLKEGSWKTELQTIEKMGGTYTALTVRQPGQTAVPAINLDKAYVQHGAGISMKQIMKEMAEAAQIRAPFGELSWLNDYDKVKDQLFIRVSNAERNQKIQSEVPFTQVEDLMITYHIRIPNTEGLSSSVAVSNIMLNRYGILKETLHTDAMENSMRILPPLVQPLDGMIQQMMPGMEASYASPSEKVFIVSNQEMTYGAAAMFYPGVMEKVSNELGGNVFILPSSTEEVLVIRADDPGEYRDLEEMVKGINQTMVRPEEQLSDSVYHYDVANRKFERADQNYARWTKQQGTKTVECRSVLKQLEENKQVLKKENSKHVAFKNEKER